MAEFDANSIRLGTTLGDLEGSLAGAEAVSQTFRREVEDVRNGLREAARDASGLARSLGGDLRSAFDDLVFDGGRLSDVLAGLGRSMAGSVLNQAITPVQNALGGAIAGGIEKLFGGLATFGTGAAFSAGRVTAFARGGIVEAATPFPMRGGVGLMGEAGPEAIMPLARGADGRLGVRAEGGGRTEVRVTINVQTPDVAGFRKSQSQIAAEVSRAIGRGTRNL